MVKPYPSSAKPVEPERPPAPPPVQKAVRLMYAGAAISTVSLILALIGMGSVKSTIRKDYPHYTASQVNHAFLGFLIIVIISAALGIALWLWMAWASNQGRNWARVVSTVLFGISTIELLIGLRGPKTLTGLLFSVLIWLVGAGAIFFLWQRESTAFFKPQGFA
jgi:hypothetical protein